MGHAAAHFFLALVRGQNVKYTKCIIKFQLQDQFQRLLNQNLCVFSQIKDIKHIKTGFSFSRLGHVLGMGLRGARRRGSKI